MARFYGKVGYGDSVESPDDSGTWTNEITEISYFGDILQVTRRLVPGEGLNNNISVSNSISILADEYATENFLAIKYVEWAGALWTVTSVEVKSPRLILHLGEVYNGPTS